LKSAEGTELLLRLVEHADLFFEPFRPGVAERLGIGPDTCLARNPRLVYGRMTGWGQEGPLAPAAGHDINYIALAGALFHFGRAGGAPTPPLNLVGDFGGGGMLLVFGLLCGLLESQRSGQGQVVDAAMVDGTALLMAIFHGFRAAGLHDETQRGVNMIDTGAHFYDVYECADGGWVSIGSIEPAFYAELLRLTGLEDVPLPDQMDREHWPEMREKLATVFRSRTRDEWSDLMEGTDVCYAPVLSMSEASRHPHNVFRETFIERDGIAQPAPAPRFSRTPGSVQGPPPGAGEHTDEILRSWLGLDADTLQTLRLSRALA
jgi:alpha-methylacyl-CoA racemase